MHPGCGTCEGNMKPGFDQLDCSFRRFASPAAPFSKTKTAVVLATLVLAGACAQVPAQQSYSEQYAAPAPQYSVYPPQYEQPQYSQSPDAAPQQPYPDQGQYGEQPPDLAEPEGAAMQPLSAGDLEQLLAPIALYPDNLLAQILAASTYPAQVAAADGWLHGMQAQGYNSPDQIAAGADAQTGWDPSVKALTAFPQVLDMLNQNLQWTTALGNAYYNQPDDVMQTVQALRQRAQQAGNLQDTPQEDVTDDQGYLDVEPTNPDVVYVPAYDPWYAYGAPLMPYPGFYCAAAANPFWGIRFGFGIGLGAFHRMPWGWGGWGVSWYSRSILYGRANYYTRSRSVRDWGFPHGGQRFFGNRGLRVAGGRGMPGNNYRTPQPYNRYGNSYDGGRRGSYMQPGERNGGLWRGNNYTRPAMPGQQAYRSMSPQSVRPQYNAGRSQSFAAGQEYSRPSSGYNNGNNSAPHYTGQPGMAYSHPYPVNRGPANNSSGFGGSGAYSSRSNPVYGGGFPRNDRTSGFRSFGNGRASSSFGGGQAASGFGYRGGGGGGNFGGGHSSGGFSHGGGFGGGGHFGGGHGRGR